jgi:hypothetical protein
MRVLMPGAGILTLTFTSGVSGVLPPFSLLVVCPFVYRFTRMPACTWELVCGGVCVHGASPLQHKRHS